MRILIKGNLRFLAFWFVIISLLSLVPEQAYCGRKALVIGNSDYKKSSLKNPVNDATDLSRVLREVGFQVQTVLDGTASEMNRAIQNFSNRVTRDDVALFYYAGHAVQFNNENYLLPIGITKNSGPIKLTKAMNSFNNADISIIIVDACRNNPEDSFFQTKNGTLTRSARGIGTRAKTGLAPPKRSMESFVAYSTDVGNVAEDGVGRNSTFTKYLLRYIKTPGIRLERVFKKVRESVARETDGEQIPWDSSSITGDFYFVK